MSDQNTTETFDLGDNPKEALKELWGLGEIDMSEELNEIVAERENDAIYTRAYLSIEPTALELGSSEVASEIPDWLRELDQEQTLDPDLDL